MVRPDRPETVAEIHAALAQANGRRLTALLDAYASDGRAGVRAACDAAAARVAAARREARRTARLYALEGGLREQGFIVVAGVDEVGRGALAGPLTAAAVVLPEAPRIESLDDSKRLTPARRQELSEMIHATALSVAIAHVSATDLDALGVTATLRRAITMALGMLSMPVDHLVIDGLPLRVFEPETAVVKGDSKVAAIAAASIVAKVARDALMVEFASAHPQYGFEVNKGYGTAEHLGAIVRHGPCELHRRSFSAGGGTMPLF